MLTIRAFVEEHYRHFNAGALASTARSLTKFLADGGRLFVTLAGAMSTAELGRSLAPMIRGIESLVRPSFNRQCFARRWPYDPAPCTKMTSIPLSMLCFTAMASCSMTSKAGVHNVVLSVMRPPPHLMTTRSRMLQRRGRN